MKLLDKNGFTLLELLIVISIIGILVTVAVASYTSSQQKARNSRRMSDMKSVQNAAEQYYADNASAYPSATASFGTYLPVGFPSDPRPAPYTQYAYSTTTSGGIVVGYCVCARMEGTVGNATDNACTFAASGSYGDYQCARNLQ